MKSKSYSSWGFLTVLGLFISWAGSAVAQIEFGSPEKFELGQYPTHLLPIDLNQDGHLDALGAAESEVHIFIGDGSGALKKANSIGVPYTARGLAVGDFDNDGRIDFAVGQNTDFKWTTTGDIFCGRNAGTLIFLGVGGVEDLEFTFKRCLTNISGPMTVGDFNEDGFEDLIIEDYRSSRSNPMYLYINHGDGTFKDPVRIGNGRNPIAIDFDIDGHLDLVSGGSAILFGLGDGVFEESEELFAYPEFALGDLNGDGLLDLAHTYSYRQFPTADPEHRLIKTLQHSGRTGSTEYEVIPELPVALKIADFDRDGRGEVMGRIGGQGFFSVFSEDGIVSHDPIGSIRHFTIVEDLDEDGFLDLVVIDSPFEEDGNLYFIKQFGGNLNHDNEPPVVSIVKPALDMVVSNDVALNVTAHDASGIRKVDYYINGSKVGSSAGPAPYRINWFSKRVEDGVYTLLARAFDSKGNSAESSHEITVSNALPTILSSPGSDPVDVGESHVYNLAVTGAEPITFSVFEGPKGVTVQPETGRVEWIPESHQLGDHEITITATNVVGSVSQTYQLSVIDTLPPTGPTDLRLLELLSDTSARITWNPSEDRVGVAGYKIYRYYYTNRWHKGYRAFDQVEGTEVVVDWDFPEWSTSRASYKVAAVDAAGNISELSNVFYGPEHVNIPPNIYHVTGSNNGEIVSYYKDGLAYYRGIVGDLFHYQMAVQGRPTPTLTLVSGPEGMTLNGGRAEWVPQPDQEGVGTAIVRATNSEGSADHVFYFHVYPSLVGNKPPVISVSAEDSFLELPDESSTVLHASALDDGLPEDGELSYSWALSSGPEEISIENPELQDIEVQFSTEGFYHFEVTVSDGELSSTGRIMVRVWQPTVVENKPPFVSQLRDATIRLPLDNVYLSAIIVDHPDPIYTYSKLSGPGEIDFSPPSSRTRLNFATTRAFFTEAGVYQVQVSADDGEFVVSTSATITVLPRISIPWDEEEHEEEDDEPPTATPGLTFDNLTYRGVDLDWEPATDNQGVAGYQVLARENEEGAGLMTVASVPASVTGTRIDSLEPEKSYELWVNAFDHSGNAADHSEVSPLLLTTLSEPPGPSFLRGDSNGDGRINLGDPMEILFHLFHGNRDLQCLDASDLDDDGEVLMNDSIFGLTYLFLGGQAPTTPGVRYCGPDPTDDDALDCLSHSSCEGQD